MKDYEKKIRFQEMDWDTDYFGVKSARVILNGNLTVKEWENLKIQFKEYDFISIQNQHSSPRNAQFIGRETSAFLADINIQFIKVLNGLDSYPGEVEIDNSLKHEDQVQIEKIGDFKFSKFIEDPNLNKRGGNRVYTEWLINAFKDSNKFFSLSRDENSNVNGYLLHSFKDDICVIELIAVSSDSSRLGIGTRLIKSLETSAFCKGIKKVKVGTQVRNIRAVNFYHKSGYKQIECNQVYHLWNI
ncbi:GNAT family N-acetyltransferase [Priestia megaterium]|uniref:GNAT family N-acetyltransferase n=1 Tax=Priestia megaterium TaxID=1404 RepID=UPI0039ED72C3